MTEVLSALPLGERLGRKSRREAALQGTLSQLAVIFKCHPQEFCYGCALSTPPSCFTFTSIDLFKGKLQLLNGKLALPVI